MNNKVVSIELRIEDGRLYKSSVCIDRSLEDENKKYIHPPKNIVENELLWLDISSDLAKKFESLVQEVVLNYECQSEGMLK